MVALVWDPTDQTVRRGIDHAVLYLDDVGIAWNGLVSVVEKPEVSSRIVYCDGKPIGTISDPGDFLATASAFTYPDEFYEYTGYTEIVDKQLRYMFGMSYRVGDSSSGEIHLVYNATALPSDLDGQTQTNAPEMNLFTWDLVAKPVNFPGMRPTAHVVIDLDLVADGVAEELGDILYGSALTDPVLPSVNELLTVFDHHAFFSVIDNGDGTWTATGPGSYIAFTNATTFAITSPTAVVLDATSYLLSSEY